MSSDIPNYDQFMKQMAADHGQDWNVAGYVPPKLTAREIAEQIKQQNETIKRMSASQVAAQGLADMYGAAQNQPATAAAIKDNYAYYGQGAALGQGIHYTHPQAIQNAILASVPFDDKTERGDEAQLLAIKAMNPIARHRYEALFKILEIKVRLRGDSWFLAKAASNNGKFIVQQWTAPSKDPGCSLKTWDAMVAELCDELSRREGVDVKTDYDYGAESTGDEAASSAGNT